MCVQYGNAGNFGGWKYYLMLSRRVEESALLRYVVGHLIGQANLGADLRGAGAARN
jgi:hypothetical protein